MEGLRRNVAPKIDKLLELFPVVIILGARQVGKTTLCRLLKPHWHYFDLHHPLHQELILSDPIGFFERYPENVVIDEAQESPTLLKVLRGVIDANRQHRGRFIITGSSSPDLKQKAAETLAGRVGLIELGTLKANERSGQPLSPLYEGFSDLKSLFDLLKQHSLPLTKQVLLSHWLKGGYPEPTLQIGDLAYRQWMENYFATYINTDITHLFPRLKKHVFQRFIKMISRLNGTIVNKSELARSLEVSEVTINEYIHIAESTFLWRSLLSYHANTAKALTKMPKGYMRDTGLLHFLLRISTVEDLLDHPISGASFETFVIEEIINGLIATLQTNWQAYHYRTKSGAEIDLILEGDFGILPIEIKKGQTVRLKQLLSLSNFVKENKLSLGLVISQSNELMWLNSHILQIPFSYL